MRKTSWRRHGRWFILPALALLAGDTLGPFPAIPGAQAGVGAGTSSLAELGFPPARWPHVTMLSLATNQDGCKNAIIRFLVSGTAS